MYRRSELGFGDRRGSRVGDALQVGVQNSRLLCSGRPLQTMWDDAVLFFERQQIRQHLTRSRRPEFAVDVGVNSAHEIRNRCRTSSEASEQLVFTHFAMRDVFP